MDGTVIVADDDRTIRTVLTQALTRAGCKVRSTGSVSTLWRWIEEGEGDAVVSDVMMPDGNGLDLLPQIHRKRPNLPVIIISAQNTVMTAIKASEHGAYDYLPKPFDLKELLSKVSRALSQSNMAAAPTATAMNSGQNLPLVGSSPAMQEVYRVVARVLNTDLNVMITGESGTGKNLLAKTLHDLGHRGSAPMVTIGAASATPESVEQILQDENKTPNGATIYLDEIAEMPADTQLRLLDLMQSPVVQDKNLRFISSTQKPLTNLVNEGLFREDLFYRLSVMPISLPPLRDRMDDISELTLYFLQKIAADGQPLKTIASKALDHMRSALWLGNVRELQNFVQRVAVLCTEEEITAQFTEETLKQMPKAKPEGVPLGNERLSSAVEAHLKRYFDLHGDQLPPPGLYNRILREVELPLIALTLSATRGNQIKTAELLGINRNTLRKKINDLDIQVTRTKKMM
ncbi:response regulator [Amylibacter sp. SFDW26]|uniref:sigma 54-interacting transcriptional regulator n=1 Tax=Amylibacter sp. SFDW26 TaxID=2652722 RepID=UPI00126245B9|nr:sigma 54-interacting transcriptional regulator [Amylibacter sp. SFDW26]KAB7615746.1 response regulator [Amylibacter sp. SFDW26]